MALARVAFVTVFSLLGGSASAGTIGISAGTLIVGTEPGDGNQVFAPVIAGSELVLPGVSFDIVTPGCTGVGTITCALAGFTEVAILGGSGDDVINLTGLSGFTFAVLAVGGPGNDVLIGTPGNVKLFGGPGDDVIIGATGNCSSRGTGSDVVISGGCFAGPDPDMAPLPRASAVPDPGGLILPGTATAALITIRRWRSHHRAGRG